MNPLGTTSLNSVSTIGGVKTTRYFEEQVLPRRPYLKREWITAVLSAAEHQERQPDGRLRFRGYIEELGRYLRVVTLEDGETVHNAFPDRGIRRTA